MIAVITGDIVNSEQYPSSIWMPLLKKVLKEYGEQPEIWDIYRGDEFQVKTTPIAALEAAIKVKAVIKSVKNLDVRIAIGIGDETYSGGRITEANGSAYKRSGRMFETLKEEKRNLALASSNDSQDVILNLMIKLALNFMDDWSTVSANTVAWTLQHPESSQEAMSRHFKIQQSAVSQRQKRARMHLLQELLEFYQTTIKQIAP
jgi:hypothetical protein